MEVKLISLYDLKTLLTHMIYIYIYIILNVSIAFANVTKEQEGFWLCRARNDNGESASCLHLIIAECNLKKKRREYTISIECVLYKSN